MASLSSVSIQRPVLAVVLSLVIIIFGIIGFNFLGVREYPNVDPPVVTVTTNYTGANANIVESQITEPLEESINGIAGISSITSVSADGRSNITIEFDLGVDMEGAANDVRDRVSRALFQLPQDIDQSPTVAKADADTNPIIAINVKSQERNMLELSNFAETVLKERLQTISGVSEIIIWGQQKYSMRLWLYPDKLAAYQLTPLDVQNVLIRENVELPSGRVEGANTELSIRTMGRLANVEEFNSLIIKESGNNIVRFRDIGRAELGPENLRTILRRDGLPSVATAIIPQPGVNQIAITDEVYKRIEAIKKELPGDLELAVVFDTTQYIRASISEVKETIFTSFVLVVLIIFLFLRDWRSTIIPTLTIPISLIGTFFIMYLMGFSINVLTLLGVVLAIGLVVDDAIVVLENIYAKIEAGMPPLQASYQGIREIFFAVIATTVALVAVFLPVVFLQGLTGRLFREFGIVVAGAVVISSFVALTLTPMLSSRMLKRSERPNWFYRVSEPFFVKLNKLYENSLSAFLSAKWLALVLMLGSLGAAYYFVSVLPSELAPLEDRNNFRVLATGQEGATFEFMDDYVKELSAFIEKEIPEREGYITVTSPGFGTSSVNSAFSRILLVEADKRSSSQQEIVDRITPKIRDLNSARAILIQEPSIGDRRGGLPVQFVLQASTLEQLKEVLPAFVQKANESGKFPFVDVNLKFNKPEIKITIDRERARNLGVSVSDIAQTLQLGLSGRRFGYFIMDGKQYQVIGQIERSDRNEPLYLRSLFVKNNRGEMIQLDNLVSLSEESTPPQLYRYNRYISATVSAGLATGVSLGEGLSTMKSIADEVLNDNFNTTLSGSSKEFSEGSSSIIFAFLLALVLIYLTLAAQFESFIDPFIVMLTVPLALAGALFSLWYFSQTLNIFSQIGMIMLIGLVTKNGILIVEFANQRKLEGLHRNDAVFEAAVSRFRPILMTTLSTVLGILPIALALGAGSESRVSMGIAVVGGLIFASLLTLYVIPALYVYLSPKEAKKPVALEEEVLEKV